MTLYIIRPNQAEPILNGELLYWEMLADGTTILITIDYEEEENAYQGSGAQIARA